MRVSAGSVGREKQTGREREKGPNRKGFLAGFPSIQKELFSSDSLPDSTTHFSRPPSEGVAEALGLAGPALAGREAARGAATNTALATACNVRGRRRSPSSSSPMRRGELDALPPPPPPPPPVLPLPPPIRDGREGAAKRRRAPRRAEMKGIFLKRGGRAEKERRSSRGGEEVDPRMRNEKKNRGN